MPQQFLIGERPKLGLTARGQAPLNRLPLVADLQSALQREVRIENDANCFALSEAPMARRSGRARVFGIILGTGVGGGIVIDGKTLTGVNAIAGEWGHNPLPLPCAEELAQARRCYCGKTSCIETWLSGPCMTADYFRLTAQAIDAAEIVMRAYAGDAACETTLQRCEERLARALASVINVIDPEIIVLGGGQRRSRHNRKAVVSPDLASSMGFATSSCACGSSKARSAVRLSLAPGGLTFGIAALPIHEVGFAIS